MYFSEKVVGARRYLIAAQAVWDTKAGQAYSRQVVLGPAGRAPCVELSETRTVGRRRVGDVGALVWVAEQLDVVGVINRACGWSGGPKSVSLGEMVLAVAVQRACAPAGKCHLGGFLGESIPRVSCLPAEAFTGQEFHRLANQADEAQLENAQLDLARAAVSRFKLGTDVLAFDTTNFDTHIATVTPGELARRGHAKSKRSDLRVVGLGVLVSETGHVPLFHRTYAGNASDHRVLENCLVGLGVCTTRSTRARAASGPASVRWCAMVARGGSRWNSTSTSRDTTRSHPCRSAPRLPKKPWSTRQPAGP